MHGGAPGDLTTHRHVVVAKAVNVGASDCRDCSMRHHHLRASSREEAQWQCCSAAVLHHVGSLVDRALDALVQPAEHTQQHVASKAMVWRARPVVEAVEGPQQLTVVAYVDAIAKR